MAWIQLDRSEALTPGSMKRYTIDDEDIVVYHLDNGWYATSDTCTHQNCSLSDEGEVDGDEIVCCCHGGAFDIRNGTATRMPCVRAIDAYAVRVRTDGYLEIDFD